jgi:NTP pyrophosphatase (non-canonical NTP hydrolase)
MASDTAWTIRQWQKAAYLNAKAHGFHDEPVPVPQALMLLVTEAAEAMECYRRGHMETMFSSEHMKPDGFPSELADIAIRLFDTAEALGIDLESEMQAKHAFNLTRPHKHGGKAC